MAKEEKKEPFLGLSWLQLIAGSLAAMTSAWIASAFGVSGTIVGAAVGSLSASIATALYMQSLSHGHRLVRGPNSLGPSASGSSADSVRSPSDATQVLSGGSPADEPDEAGSNSRRNRQIVIGTIVALALALGTIGVIELVRCTSRRIRITSETLSSINESRIKQFSFPLPSLAQLALPLIGRVAAGSPILAQEHVDQTYYVENSLFQRKPDYLLKVRGMSMRDAGIMDGDLLAVQATKDAKNGQIVVARLGDEVTVKRFRRNKHLIELHPENPDYQTIVVEPGEPFEIEGLAVGLIRNTMLM